ncbi:hypothetical protein A3B46_02990 [Candidatus Roizmanbacteria bacterium RIFCSPLOWO2_01_FULL_39_19]|nr:MAG: hypothetical protein A3B46_02990 [Candidatus Roizmanbacteria bacterium RIFCSPLOWO2_01_FULL_39_19]
MNKALKWLIFFFIGINLIFSAWSYLHQDIFYQTDNARDFLIMDEIADKKMVLIGPRADKKGVFHGILWHYLNMPAYIIGKGNPIATGWFWFLLTVGLISSIYFVVKKLFDETSALIALVLSSAYLVPYVQGFYHGSGALLSLPLYFYFFVKYFQTKQWKFLIGHLFMLGAIVQFQLAIGGPLLILSTLASLFVIIKNKKFLHLLCFGTLLIFASSFLLIDIRHDFLQTKSIIKYVQGERDQFPMPFSESVKNRIENITTRGFNLFRNSSSDLNNMNLLIFALFVFSFVVILKSKIKYRHIYIIFLYFHIGYYFLTLIHRGLMLELWWFPMTLLPLMMFSTFHKFVPKHLYFVLLGILLVLMTSQNISHANDLSKEIGNNTRSWKFHLNNMKQIFSDAPEESGIFIYSPDIYGYQDKYALSYVSRVSEKKIYKFEKKPTTYILMESPPKERIDLVPTWWIENKLHIKSQPEEIIKLSGGYEIRKYELIKEDLEIPSEITTADWLYFR